MNLWTRLTERFPRRAKLPRVTPREEHAEAEARLFNLRQREANARVKVIQVQAGLAAGKKPSYRPETGA